MAKKIFKYQIKHGKTKLPVGAQILAAGKQGDDICVWALVDPGNTLVDTFAAFHTGEIMPPEPGKYINTFLLGDRQDDVLHLFQLTTYVAKK